MNHTEPDFQVGIIGGGPAGSSMAAYLAKAGIKCVVFESELFPRPHVGESLVPSSTRVFREIDFLEQMEEHKFVHKYGAVWTAASNFKDYSHQWEGLETDCQANVRFDEREQPGVGQNYTYHVDRAKFDLALLQHAHKLGATVYEGIKVKHVDFAADNHARVHFSMGKKEMAVNVRMVVDASGRRTFLGNQLKLRMRDPVFDQYAIYTWFEDFDRTAVSDKRKEDYIVIHFLPVSNTWVWQIPITETITSIGVVTQKKHFAKSRASRESFFWECVATRPELLEALKKARHIPPFYEEGDYSYAMKQICGDRFVLIGDAARFVDPIFSTGVSIALNSARFASRDAIAALQNGGITRDSFKQYETTIRRGTNNWYNFISVYYRLNILFTAFINDPRYRLDVLKLLQGDVYDEEEPAVLTRMRNMVAAVESNPDHVWHNLLGDLTGNAFKPIF
jgi:1H-pyrrole-2-carbonyl-[peptidyl-carrier protein] chlorinase